MNEQAYFPEYVHVAGRQVLETLDILATSKVLSTIKSRYDFIAERIDPSGFPRPLTTLQIASSNPRYTFDIQQALEGYRQMYYDRVVSDYALAILAKPNEIDFPDLYCRSLVRAAADIVREEVQEISKLKRESAVVRRKAKLSETLVLLMAELTAKCRSAAVYPQAKEAIEKVIASVQVPNRPIQP